MDANAYILYGFVLTEEEAEIARGEDGFVDWEGLYGSKVEVTPGGFYRGKVRQAIEDSGVEVQSTGWADEPTYVAHARAGEVHAYYGDIREFDPWRKSIGDEAKMADDLERWCKVTGIEYRPPKWLLANRLSS